MPTLHRFPDIREIRKIQIANQKHKNIQKQSEYATGNIVSNSEITRSKRTTYCTSIIEAELALEASKNVFFSLQKCVPKLSKNVSLKF